MYLNALEFLEEEREAWRPYEALLDLPDEDLSEPLDGAHGWSGRDLMGHMAGWLEHTLVVARELAIGETSPAKEQADRDWDARGDAINDEMVAEWRLLPMSEVRRRFREVPGELRGYLTVVPESRWIKHADHLRFFLDETTDHYAAHASDLEAVLEAARG
ncbi:MAG TPA: maleylpyruvate isomerase N-terminal domain-containing protein [Candidatus Limnocylindrales bacterium]|nr:maleylpyruvate isomerase N-terminal domain-containing protein [Candidatus Limnocylindrales bacterium]